MAKNIRKTINYIAVAIGIGLVIIALIQKQTPRNQSSRGTFDPGSGSGDCAFHPQDVTSALDYSKHARCRMKCRDISQALVEDVYQNGSLNCAKSDPTGQKDGTPRYALELEDGIRGRVRIIVGDNPDNDVIITAIRLDEKDHCACP